MVVVIRAYAPDRFYATLHLYKVGRLDVILDQIAGTSLVLLSSDMSRSQEFAGIRYLCVMRLYNNNNMMSLSMVVMERMVVVVVV